MTLSTLFRISFRIVLTVAAGMGAAEASAVARKPTCSPDKLNIDKAVFREIFEKKYCSVSKRGRCNTRWDNFSTLLDRSVNDSRVPSVGFAAYMYATAVIETMIRDLSPAAEEIFHVGEGGKVKDYWRPDSQTGKTYHGRGWVQFTAKGKYEEVAKLLKIDLVAYPEKALEPINSYEILVRALSEGWLETYRSNKLGGPGYTTPRIRLGDFISQTSVDYGHARAVVNANCIRCKKNANNRFNHKGLGYIPYEDKLDRGGEFEREAIFFEKALCASLKNQDAR